MALNPLAGMFGFGLADKDQSEQGGTIAILDDKDRAIFVLMLEIEGTDTRAAVQSLISKFAQHRVVFVHTTLDFRPFMEAHAVFERLPSLEEIARFPTLLNWPAYLADRQALLFAKWRPDRIIRYGIDLEEYSYRVAAICHGSFDAD